MTNASRSVKIYDLVHSRIAGGRNLFCAWPFTGGIHSFGGGEIVFTYTEKPSAYQTPEDVKHHETQARQVLCRTLDGGQSWPDELRQVVRDNQVPFDEWIQQGGQPQPVDMTGKDAMFLFWRSFSGEPWRAADGELHYRPVTFALRSTDRGYTWHMPAVIVPNYHLDSIWGMTSYLKQPDGTILAGFGADRYAPVSSKSADAQALAEADRTPWETQEIGRRPTCRCVLYISKDQGLHWYYFSTIAYEDNDGIECSYPAFVRLPSGRILCTVGYRFIRGSISWTSVTCSDDDGRTWAAPRRINDLGDQANLCQLSDGRIVCIYGYRFVPYGIRGIVSEDDGQTWSDEFVIRADGAGPDLGYLVITELPDGRILTVYYFNVDDGVDVKLLRGGRRFIATSTFRLA